MQAAPLPADALVLVLAEPQAAQRRATALRLAGVGAWVATCELTVHWLFDRAWVRPNRLLVEIPDAPAQREELMAAFGSFLANNKVPAVVVGGSVEDRTRVKNLVATLPAGASADTVMKAVTGAA